MCYFQFLFVNIFFYSMQAQGKEKIVLKAMGRAINKAVTIAEILKRKMPLRESTKSLNVD